MSAEIKNLSPQPVWGYFYDLTQIPRPTGHMEAVTRFMVAFGKGLGLETLQDEVGNVLIRKPASQRLRFCQETKLLANSWFFRDHAVSPRYGSAEELFGKT